MCRVRKRAATHSRPLSLFSRSTQNCWAVVQEMTLDEWEALNPRATKEPATKKPNKVSTVACPAQVALRQLHILATVVDLATLP